MPIYEYKCTKCEQTFEVMQTFSDAPLGTHPGCGGEVRRVISAPGIIFKGSGFHVTDYPKDKAGESKAASPPEKKSETKSETKSEPKSDSKLEPKPEKK